MNPNKKSWDLHARRFYTEGELPLDYVDFDSSDYPSDKDLNIIGDVEGLTVLEIGSGSCNCGIALARNGANVTCSDLSQEQLNIGKEVAEKAGVAINLVCADMTDLSFAPPDTFDLVISMSALDYVEDFDKVCSEVKRVLKHGGRFIFCATHPVMSCVAATELFPEENAPPNYNYRGAITWKWHENDDFVFTTYRRQMSDFVNELGKNNLMIKRMEELFPVTDDFDEKELAVRTRFPSILVMETVRC